MNAKLFHSLEFKCIQYVALLDHSVLKTLDLISFNNRNWIVPIRIQCLKRSIESNRYFSTHPSNKKLLHLNILSFEWYFYHRLSSFDGKICWNLLALTTLITPWPSSKDNIVRNLSISHINFVEWFSSWII